MKSQRIQFGIVFICMTASLGGCAYAVDAYEPDDTTLANDEALAPEQIPPKTDVSPSPQIVDLCPNDPNKLEPGLCGCGNSDDNYQPVDSDGDGVVDCADACPFNAHKTQPLQSGCDVPDSDGDGFDDGVDFCPTNPNLHEQLNETLSYQANCLVDESQTFHVYAPQDLKYLPQTDNIQTIRLESDINLNARKLDLGEAPASCDLSLSSTLYFDPVTLDGNYHTLRNTTADGQRCALDNYLFESLNGASNLTLDLDYNGKMLAGLAKQGRGMFANVHYQGTFAFAGEVRNVGGLFNELSNCLLQNTTTQNAHFLIKDARFGAMAYSIDHCQFEMPTPMHIAELNTQGDASARVYGIAAKADTLSKVDLTIDTLSGIGAGIAGTCQQLSQSTIKIGKSDGAPALLDSIYAETDAGWSIQNVSVSLGDLRNAPVLLNNALATEMTPGKIADVTSTVTGRVTYDMPNALSGLFGAIELNSSQCQQNALLTIERLESRIPVVELNAPGAFGGIVSNISVTQPTTTYQLEYCQKTTPTYALILDQINSYITRIEHNAPTRVGGLLGGIENLSEDSNLVPACYLHKIMPSILIKNVLSFANIYTNKTILENVAQLAAYITQPAEQNLLYSINGKPDLWSPQANWPLPIWPVLSTQALVLAGDIQDTSNYTHRSERIIASLDTPSVQSYANFNYQDTFAYYYNNSANTLPDGITPIPIAQTNAMDAHVVTLQSYSSAWSLSQTRLPDNALIKIPYLKLTKNSGF